MSLDSAYAKLQSFLEVHPAIKHTRYVVHDYHNVPLCLLTTTTRALLIAQEPENTEHLTCYSSAQFAFLNTGQITTRELLREGTSHWVPDWDTLKPTIESNQGMVFCWIGQTKHPQSQWYDQDPRSTLQRVLDKAELQVGLEFLVG